MHFIKFEAELRGQFKHMQEEWMRSLAKQPGTVLTMHQEVWGPPDGAMLSVACSADLKTFLKAKRFPFHE